MDTDLPQKCLFILDMNLAKANCTEDRVCTSCDTVVLDRHLNRKKEGFHRHSQSVSLFARKWWSCRGAERQMGTNRIELVGIGRQRKLCAISPFCQFCWHVWRGNLNAVQVPILSLECVTVCPGRRKQITLFSIVFPLLLHRYTHKKCSIAVYLCQYF